MFFRLLIFWDMTLHPWPLISNILKDHSVFMFRDLKMQDKISETRLPERVREHLIPGEQNSQSHDCKTSKCAENVLHTYFTIFRTHQCCCVLIMLMKSLTRKINGQQHRLEKLEGCISWTGEKALLWL
jgi:hypothetical protein